MVRLRFDGAAKGAVEKVQVDITAVISGGRPVATDRLSQAETIGSAGILSVEPVLIGAADRLWLTIGAASADVHMIARHAWRFEEIEPQWDRLVLRCFTGGRIVQEGSLATLGAPRALIVRSTGSKRLAVGLALFCGPLPGGGSPAADTDIATELEDPVLGRKLGFPPLVP